MSQPKNKNQVCLKSVKRLGRSSLDSYEYDNTIPLEAHTVEVKEIDRLRREKIVFRTTQGFFASGYLQLPATGTAPFPCVLLLHGWSGSEENWYQDNNDISGGNIRKRLLEQGYAVFMLNA